MIQIGQGVRFNPFETVTGNGVEEIRQDVIGTVVEIHVDHKWFSVQYGKLRTSFKFCDIGKNVFLVGVR